jgi:hypothetical protein
VGLVGHLAYPFGTIVHQTPYAQIKDIRARKNVPRYGEEERMGACVVIAATTLPILVSTHGLLVGMIGGNWRTESEIPFR